MSSWARPGVKCVCIDANPNSYAYIPGQKRNGDIPLEQGRVYTIRQVRFVRRAGIWTVKLEGIPDRSNRDRGYALSRFRPLITKTQEDDVALFRGLLTGAPAGVDA